MKKLLVTVTLLTFAVLIASASPFIRKAAMSFFSDDDPDVPRTWKM